MVNTCVNPDDIKSILVPEDAARVVVIAVLPDPVTAANLCSAPSKMQGNCEAMQN